MKLFQALKLKNKLVGEISNVKSLILRNNSIAEGEKTYYNSKELFDKLKQHISDLTNLKVAINKANINIQQTIYDLGETKSMLDFIKSLTTVEGKVNSRRGFSETIEQIFIVGINELEKNNIASKYQTSLDQLQDKIDIYNHTTDCDIDETKFLINIK